MNSRPGRRAAPGEAGSIEVYGARANNLKGVDVSIPRGSLSVVTGLSGSGKSSLAFDTIYAEGQRRYIETFSAYARNFLGGVARPDVDKITGLSPVISIEQKTTSNNPRSTVGTTTEVYDFVRLLYARAATAYSHVSGEKMVKYTEEQTISAIMDSYLGRRIYLLAPLVRQRKGHYRELFESLRRKGLLQARVDGEILPIERGMKTDRYRNHDIEAVVDKCVPSGRDDDRLARSIAETMKMGEGAAVVVDAETGEARTFSRHLMDPVTGMSYPDPAPNMFSFNSKEGCCPLCNGLGQVEAIDEDALMPDKGKSIPGGAIPLLGKKRGKGRNVAFAILEALLAKHGLGADTPVGDMPGGVVRELLYGSPGGVPMAEGAMGGNPAMTVGYQGIKELLGVKAMAEGDEENPAEGIAVKLRTCPGCKGARLRPESLAYRLWDKNIAEVAGMELSQLREWIDRAEEALGDKQRRIAAEIFKEIRTRLDFMLGVGLGYLSLSRPAATLSGGESQRIRLATQIGSQLVNVLYILDEPSIGLHQRDNERLIASLKQLRDIGNTVVVVEHDQDMMEAADYIVDIGPGAGRKGGEVVFQGTPAEMEGAGTLTADYLSGKREIAVPEQRRKGNGRCISIRGASGNNLKSVDADFPLGTLTVVTGVSGSGKSTLVNETLKPILARRFNRSQGDPMPYGSVAGLEYVDKVVGVDQSPIGRTPRSNPVTYTGVFSAIRSLFVNLPEAKIRGYKPGRFSFNVKGGRCEACGGSGYNTVEMNFLPDVTVPCEACRGKRYNRETLEVRFKGKSIADVLDMTVNQAVEFFGNVPEILHKIKTLQDVGLGYIKLGQPSTTISGGESQRVKLATELSKKDTGKTVFILDEPTTGLHFEDIRVLLGVLQKLVDKGNTVIVIEHNMDVVKVADHIIDMGPEGGRGGGTVLATGTPEEIAAGGKGHTARFVAEALLRSKRRKD